MSNYLFICLHTDLSLLKYAYINDSQVTITKSIKLVVNFPSYGSDFDSTHVKWNLQSIATNLDLPLHPE